MFTGTNGRRLRLLRFVSMALLACGIDSTGHAQVRRGTTDATSDTEEESTPAEQTKAALQRLRTVMEEKDYVEFVEWFAPVDDLRQIREQNAVQEVAASLNEWPHRAKMIAMLKHLEEQSPAFDPSGGVAAYEVDLLLGAEPDEGSDTPVVEPEELDVSDVPGIDGDLPVVLAEAAALLEDEKIEEFVEHMFPVEEVARMRKDDRFAGLLERLEEHPEMVETMIDDLLAAAELEPKFDESGNVGQITLPSSRPLGEERNLYFEKQNGHWRLDNQAGKIRDNIARQLTNDPVGPGAGYALRLERIGDHWRLLEFPEFVSKIVLPE